MIDRFDEDNFLNLLEGLATEKGPSLFEEPRRIILQSYLEENDIDTRVDAAGNLWVEFGEGRWEDSIVFDAHIDVVQKGYTSEVKYKNGKLIGMGVADNLTAVTMLAMLCKVINKEAFDLKRPLKILFSVGEEGDGNLKGVRQVVEDHPVSPYVFISFDLSFGEYSVSALGSRRYKISILCPGGHSWGAYGIPSAVDELFVFFELLKKEYLSIEKNHSGDISFNVGKISGGEGINSIPKSSEATFEFRSVDGKLLEKLNSVVFDIINRMAKKKDVVISCIVTGERPASHAVKPERIEPLVKQLLKTVCENTESVPRSTNINIPLVSGWPSVCLGLCRSGRFHSEEEYLEIASLSVGWELLLNLFRELAMT